MSGAAKRADHGGQPGARSGTAAVGERASAGALRELSRSGIRSRRLSCWPLWSRGRPLGAAGGRPAGPGPVVGVDLPASARRARPAGGRSRHHRAGSRLGRTGAHCGARRRLGAVEARRGPQPPQHWSAAARPEPPAAVPAGRPQHRRVGQVTNRGGPGGDLAPPDRPGPRSTSPTTPPTSTRWSTPPSPPSNPASPPRRGTRTGRPTGPHAEHAYLTAARQHSGPRPACRWTQQEERCDVDVS